MDPSRTGSESGRPKPKLFSMSQSRALLENQRLNTPTVNYSQNSSNLNQDRRPPQNPPRISLTSFLTHPSRISAATPPRNTYDTAKERGDENGGSSPLFQSSASPERAYIPSIRPPSPSKFGIPSQTPLKPSISGTPRPQPLTVDDESDSHDIILRHINTTSSRYKELTIRNEQLEQMYNQSAHELQECRAQLQLTAAQLDTARCELNEIRPALATSRDEGVAKDAELVTLKTLLSEVRENFNQTSAEYSGLKESSIAERVEIGKLQKMLELSKRRIASLSEGYTSVRESFNKLKRSHDDSQTHLAEVIKEAEETRKTARNALAALEPMLDDNNTLARAEETRLVLRELQDDLTSSQQVIDILRNKLHHQASQLADSFNRVKELEEEKRGSLRELLLAREDEKRHFELLIAVERKVAELSERLVTREKETIDALASAAMLEANLKAALKENIANKANSDAFLSELEKLRSLKEENVSKLLALQDVINTRDKEIVSLKADVKSLNESKSELRALLAESKRNLADKEVELRAKDPNDALVDKIRVLEAENESVRVCLRKLEEKHLLHQKTSQNLQFELSGKVQASEKEIAVLMNANKSLEKNLSSSVPKALHDSLVDENLELKERLKVQSLALFQAKEDCSALKERVSELHHSRQSLVTEITELRVMVRLEDYNGDLCLAKEESSKLKERVSSLTSQLATAREQYTTQLAAIQEQHTNQLAAVREQKTILQSSLNKQQDAGDLLSKAQEARVSSAENAAAMLTTQLEDATQALADTKTEVANLKGHLKAAKEALLLAEKETSQATDEEVMRLNVIIGDLESTIAELSKHAGDILRRYKLGQLSDPERELVGYIMAQAQSIHEDAIVTKNNELRRREHTIEALNAKVVELQGIVARLLQEKGGHLGSVNKSIIDSNTRLSLPEHMNANMTTAVPHVDEPPVVASTSCAAPTLTPSSHRVSNLPGPLESVQSKTPWFRDIDGDVDSEDDIPLSLLSKLTEDESDSLAATGNGTKRVRSSSPLVIDEPNRSKRRNKTSSTIAQKEKVEDSSKPSVAPKKITETKSKQKKRK